MCVACVDAPDFLSVLSSSRSSSCSALCPGFGSIYTSVEAGHRTWQVQDAPFSGYSTVDDSHYRRVSLDCHDFRFVAFRWSQIHSVGTGDRSTCNHGGNHYSAWGIGWNSLDWDSRVLLHWDGKTLTDYKDHTGYIFSIMEARDKTIWIGRGHAGDNDGPLCQVLGPSLRCHGANEGIRSSFISEMAQDTNGEFLLGTINTIIRWTPELVSTGHESS